MKIILSPYGVIFPCLSFKQTVPVVWLISPDIIIAVWIILSFTAFKKPGMLIGCVIHHKIHDDFQPKAVGFFQDLFEHIQGSVLRMDVFVIGNIIAKIRIWRRIQRRKPYGVHTQGFNVIKLIIHTVQIPDTIAVAIGEASYPYLIKAHSLVINLHFIISCYFLPAVSYEHISHIKYQIP